MIVRAPRPRSYFTQIRNELARDHTLSYKARGLLVAMLSYPDYWRFRIEDLAKGSPDGRHAISSGLKELEQRGYIKRRTVRLADGTYSSRMIVFDAIPTDEPADDLLDAAIHSDPVDELGTTGLTGAGYPRRKTGSLLEHCEKNNVQGVSSRTYKGNPRLCGKCNGTGRLITNDDIEDCHQCGGAGIL